MADLQTLVHDEMDRAGSPSYSIHDLGRRRDRKLEELAERLRNLGAEVGTPESDPHGGGVGLAFRDPDNIQARVLRGRVTRD